MCKFSQNLPISYTHLFCSLTSVSSPITLPPQLTHQQENTPSTFSWEAKFPTELILGVVHSFHFRQSTSAGQTTFVHEESFEGLLGWIMSDSELARWTGVREKARMSFEQFNADFKGWVEKD